MGAALKNQPTPPKNLEKYFLQMFKIKEDKNKITELRKEMKTIKEHLIVRYPRNINIKWKFNNGY